MSFVQPVGKAPCKNVRENSKQSSSSPCTSPEAGKTVFKSGTSKKFPATVWTLHGVAVSMKILGNFSGRVASMTKQQFVDTVVSHCAKVRPRFPESPFIKHTNVSHYRSFAFRCTAYTFSGRVPHQNLHFALQVAMVTSEPVRTEKFLLQFQVEEVVFAPRQESGCPSRKSTVRCNGNLAQFFEKNLAVSDVLMITGGTLFCPGIDKWTEVILDLTDEKVKGPVSIVRLINTVRAETVILKIRFNDSITLIITCHSMQVEQKDSTGTDEEPKRTAFGKSELNNQVKIQGKQWTDLNNNETAEIGK